MTVREQSSQDPERKARDRDIVGAEAAFRRAAAKARERAFRTTGKVAVFKGGRVVWQKPDGTFTNDPEGRPKPP